MERKEWERGLYRIINTVHEDDGMSIFIIQRDDILILHFCWLKKCSKQFEMEKNRTLGSPGGSQSCSFTRVF